MPATATFERSAQLRKILDEYAAQPMLRRLASQSPLVPPEGPAGSPVMLVGEAAGEKEVELLRPFVGRAGAVLDKALKKADIERKWSWVTNVVLYRPPANRTPYPFEVALSRSRLMTEIGFARPSFVIALGSTAWQGVSPFASREGARYEEVRGVPQLLIAPQPDGAFHECHLLVTWHPAATFHSDQATSEFEHQITGMIRSASHGA
jgi:uracil-DNA glycosylase family 4